MTTSTTQSQHQSRITDNRAWLDRVRLGKLPKTREQYNQLLSQVWEKAFDDGRTCAAERDGLRFRRIEAVTKLITAAGQAHDAITHSLLEALRENHNR